VTLHQHAERLPVTAAILAGGRSTRMGVDKTLLAVEGSPLVRRVAEAAVSVCAHTIVVTNRPEALPAAGLPEEVAIITDEVPWQGPLGGLVSALAAAKDDWVLALAADTPFLEPEVIRTLWERRDGAKAVVVRTPDGLEPLLALYHIDVLPVARAVMDTGRRRPIAILADIPVVEVPSDQLRAADPELASLVNINTPDDLEAVVVSGPEADTRGHGDVHELARPLVVEVGTARGRKLPVERPITVYLGDDEVATMQATPDDLPELAAGFLVAEGLLVDRDKLDGIVADHKRGFVYVTTSEDLDPELLRRSRYITAGCGKGVTFASVGHALGIEPVTSDLTLTSSELYELVGQLARGATRYRDTGGMQSCGLGRNGRVEIIREDVGRHNAVDKTLGRAWLDRVPLDDAVLVTSGRISYEMAVKAAKARVPVVASRTAVTDLAAEVADRAGVTLVGYARGGRMNVYTHPERVLLDDVEPADRTDRTDSEEG
jgi:FdhD protein